MTLSSGSKHKEFSQQWPMMQDFVNFQWSIVTHDKYAYQQCHRSWKANLLHLFRKMMVHRQNLKVLWCLATSCWTFWANGVWSYLSHAIQIHQYTIEIWQAKSNFVVLNVPADSLTPLGHTDSRGTRLLVILPIIIPVHTFSKVHVCWGHITSL